MEIKASVQLNKKQVFNFLMHHTYFSFMGYIGILISICAVGAIVMTWGKMPLENEILLFLAALLFTVIQPLMLYVRSGRQIQSSEAFRIPMQYEFSSQGMYVVQGNDGKLFRWDEITKITSTSMSVLVYTGKNHAFVITKEALGTKLDDLRTLAKKYATASYVKVK